MINTWEANKEEEVLCMIQAVIIAGIMVVFCRKYLTVLKWLQMFI